MGVSLHYETVVRQKVAGTVLLWRVALVALYVLFGASFVALCLANAVFWPLFSLLPLSLWLLVFITWRYVSVEFEYALDAGVFTACAIYGKRSRRKIAEIALKDAVRIAPLDDEDEAARAAAWRPERSFCAVSSFSAPAIFFILFEFDGGKGGEKRRAVFYFEGDRRSLDICRSCNPSATVLPPDYPLS